MPGNDRRHAGRGAGPDDGQGGVGPQPIASLPGDKDVIRFLNLVLRNELTAINQYFLHSRMLADWGLSRLAKQEYDESVDEMRHADWLIKRILMLGGLPNLQDLGKIRVGENVQEVLGCDRKLEQQTHPELKKAVAHAEQVGDYVSRELFVRILDNEESHIDWLQTQLRLIAQMGLQNYVQLQSESKGATESASTS